MITARFDAASVARARFAVSPIYEAAVWLGLTAAKRPHPNFGTPGTQARAALADRDVAIAALLTLGSTKLRASDRYMPDFLSPNPTDGPVDSVLAEQLDQVISTPPDLVRAQLDELRVRSGIDLPVLRRLCDSQSLPDIAAIGLRKFFQAAITECWPTIERASHADISIRAADAARHGIGHTVSRLHPSLAWQDSVLRIDKPYDEDFDLTDRDIVLQPSVLAVPRVAHQLTTRSDASVTYPAAPIVSLAVSRVRDHELLGAGRHAVLSALDAPASTTELARRVSLAVSTVSYHLSVLLEAGLVVKARRGKSVAYERTAAAHTLLSAGATGRGAHGSTK